MFQQSRPCSFIFAIALTHVFSSASQLLRSATAALSALLSVSMINAALGVIINWLGLWELKYQAGRLLSGASARLGNPN